MAIDYSKPGKTRPGTKHTRVVRKSPVGHVVDVEHKSAPTWHELVVPGPQPTGVKRKFSAGVSAPSYVTIPLSEIPAPFPGQERRRVRREQEKADRRHALNVRKGKGI